MHDSILHVGKLEWQGNCYRTACLLSPQESLCLRNAELSNNLAATRHSRTLLEREVVSLKRSVLESRSCQAQLEGELAEVRREREILAERVAETLESGVQTRRTRSGICNYMAILL